MLNSMTAYGRGVANLAVGQFSIEIQSVNRKHLEIQTFLPRELSQFDVELKKWISSSISRGQVTIKANVTFHDAAPFVIRPNLILARQLKEAWSQIAKELGVEEFSLSLLKESSGLLTYEENRAEEENFRQALKLAFDEALKNFLQMKRHEGAVLEKDILSRLNKMGKEMKVIEEKAPEATVRYREKLQARLEEVLPGKIENEERILREIALFAEKIDIMEEITRFNCHLSHFEELTRSNESVGKTLEFLVQELNREINTIGAKSSELVIARGVIDIKTEIERIREQIQNIE